MFYDFMKKTIMAFGIFSGISALALEVNVLEQGAKGDGIADDSAAIVKATTLIEKNGGGLLYFPHGTYRFALQKRGAVAFTATSDITVRFAPGAVLLMDNLKKDGNGGGHGVLITGPCRNVNLENITVQWKNKPAKRSQGDGFRFEGYPDDAQTIADIRMNNCRTIGAPQTGAVFMGCSDIFVFGFNPVNTLADGLHFNACRRVNVNGVTGINNGDDTLAFVTYYTETPSGKIGTVFSRSSLDEWCNSGSVANNIISRDGHADGMRISGGLNILVNNISVNNKWGGIQLDAALATTENRKVGWSYLASRGINISNGNISGCSHGFIVRSLNIPADAPEAFWLFDLRASNLQISKCKQLGVDIQNVGGVTVNSLSTDSGMTLLNARGRYDIKDITVSDSKVLIHGIQGKTFFGYNPANMEPLPVKVNNDLSDLADGDIVISGMLLKNAPISIIAVSGLCVKGLECRGKSGVNISSSRDCRFSETEPLAEVKTENSVRIVLPAALKDNVK